MNTEIDRLMMLATEYAQRVAEPFVQKTGPLTVGESMLAIPVWNQARAALQGALAAALAACPPVVNQQMTTALALVREQAEGDGLWFDAERAPEAHLQQALRELHAAVEADSRAHGTPPQAEPMDSDQEVAVEFYRLNPSAALLDFRNRIGAASPAAPATEMDAAIAAGDGTLHGAIDHWQERTLKAEAALKAAPVSADRIALRKLVDIVWGHAYEDQSVPATAVADRLIDRWQSDTHPAPVNAEGGEREDISDIALVRPKRKAVAAPSPADDSWTSVAARKLQELKDQGWAVNGVAIFKRGKRGLVDYWGYVGWHDPQAADDTLRVDAEHHGLDNDRQVFFYEQDFYVLSNFSAFNLRWQTLTFPTAEHAYHWAKFLRAERPCRELRARIHKAESAHAAFKTAEEGRLHRRLDWDDVKVDIMRDILRAKADQHEYVRRKLLATGDRELIENSWRDSFWGWGPNRDGQNMLGKLWMEIRAELRALDKARAAGVAARQEQLEADRG